jgi:superfamily II DNA or RNA helicase
MSEGYRTFLEGKRRTIQDSGRTVDPDELHPSLFPHQAHVVRWAARRGRAAVFLDTGLGKSRIASSWANAVAEKALIITPLSIATQTVREAAAIDLEARYVRDGDDVTGPGLWVTNYEMAERFKPGDFDAVVIDESSILKAHTGTYRNYLIDAWGAVPHRLACTATPAPNDTTELANHAEFIGAMSRVEMLAAYFVHDADGWRPKGHALEAMYDWMSTWAVAARRPSDLGPYDDTPYRLPPLSISAEVVEFTDAPDGQLFATTIGGVTGRSRLRRATMAARLQRAAEMLTGGPPSIAWCGLNPEAAELARMLGVPDLHGSLPVDAKVEIIEAFVAGEIPTLVTKPSIAGMGLNLQRATRQVFVGIGDSYESYYQAIRRSWRFGQTSPVDVRIVVSELEQQIVENVRRKESDAAAMTDRLVCSMRAATERRSAA